MTILVNKPTILTDEGVAQGVSRLLADSLDLEMPPSSSTSSGRVYRDGVSLIAVTLKVDETAG